MFPCFNLSILECKYDATDVKKSMISCFNLSILECKFIHIAEVSTDCNSFNLSILECKFPRGAGRSGIYIVLIYPYWNVNRCGRHNRRGGENGFNLSILECKSRADDFRLALGRGFNLSILECKCSMHLHRDYAALWF